jgi:hypothetical protein
MNRGINGENIFQKRFKSTLIPKGGNIFSIAPKFAPNERVKREKPEEDRPICVPSFRGLGQYRLTIAATGAFGAAGAGAGVLCEDDGDVVGSAPNIDHLTGIQV